MPQISYELCHFSKERCRVTKWPLTAGRQHRGRAGGLLGPSHCPRKGRRRKADCMGHAPFSRGSHSKRLILPLKGEIHDLFGLGMGNFGTLSLDFPVLVKEERLCGGPGPRRGFQVCPGSGKALALATAAGHCTLASLHSYA